ncbi:hypothetical protein C5468_23705 [Photorhabdus luminescens subsp. mexicana]|uniref:Bro-N domain-containing protein n=1 Tax=Photorhabdus luminescens subsp. mexicana TaxID=2100167 RepID=A0A4R4IRP0_PHOLU|nr:hypothetical protein C5468_23705 [Photorhabdus luminescens subsp. mexicana]
MHNTINVAITPFTFQDKQIRTLVKNGEPWFVAQDICDALKIANSRDAIAKLDDDEKDVALTDTLGGKQNLNIISESGMYFLTIRCRDAIKSGTLPYRFRKWVTGEVLPAIRKTGSYHRSLVADLSFNGQVLSTIENGVTVKAEKLRDDQRVLTLNEFMFLAQKAGYLIIHKNDFLSMENRW